jgi:hypothetical protein
MMATSLPCAAPIKRESDEAGFVTLTYEIVGSPPLEESASLLHDVNILPMANARKKYTIDLNNVFIA